MHPTNRNLQLMYSVCMHLKFLAKYITHSMYYKHLLQLHILWYGFPTLTLLAIHVDVVAMRILI